jgi:hypothetical protein
VPDRIRQIRIRADQFDAGMVKMHMGYDDMPNFIRPDNDTGQNV